MNAQTTLSEPRRRLIVVDDLADDAAASSVWARTSVWLLRLALEHALADLWATQQPELASATMRAQLLVLPKYLDAEDAWRVSELWHILSRVAHHHAYELTPTSIEILAWRSDVERAVTALEVRTAGSARR